MVGRFADDLPTWADDLPTWANDLPTWANLGGPWPTVAIGPARITQSRFAAVVRAVGRPWLPVLTLATVAGRVSCQFMPPPQKPDPTPATIRREAERIKRRNLKRKRLSRQNISDARSPSPRGIPVVPVPVPED